MWQKPTQHCKASILQLKKIFKQNIPEWFALQTIKRYNYYYYYYYYFASQHPLTLPDFCSSGNDILHCH